MRLFTKVLFIPLFSLTAGYASAVTVILDGFDDASIAATNNATPTDSDTVGDALNNDLFTTRQIKLTSDGTNQVANIQADTSVAGAIAYSADTGVRTTYEILYTFASPTDLTFGNGVTNTGDLLEVFVNATDFKADLDVRINGAVAYTNLGELPAGVAQTSAPGIVSFNLTDFPGALTSVSSLEFRIIPRDINGFRAASADGEYDFFRFNVAQVPLPSAALMMLIGLMGVRRIRTSA